MKIIISLAAAAPLLCACAAPGPATSWGKPGVSMTQYRLDGAECAVLAATTNPDVGGANSAGGVQGHSKVVRRDNPADSVRRSPTATQGPAAPPSTLGSGNYRDSAPPDLVNRAANDQQARTMNEQRERTDALHSCLIARGYKEFALTPEQRKHLATLPQGSDARREYLHKLGGGAPDAKPAAGG